MATTNGKAVNDKGLLDFNQMEKGLGVSRKCIMHWVDGDVKKYTRLPARKIKAGKIVRVRFDRTSVKQWVKHNEVRCKL